MRTLGLLLLSLSLATSSCGSRQSGETADVAKPQSESERLAAFFERSFAARLARSPELQTSLGLRTDYGLWDDRSTAAAQRDLERWKRELTELEAFDFEALDEASQLSYQLFEYATRMRIEGHAWRLHSYPVNQMHGLQSELPAFLINKHKIESVSDAEAYISRLQGMGKVLATAVAELELRAEAGIRPPKFVYAHVLRDCRNAIAGAPFEGSGESLLYSDFRKKLATLDLAAENREELEGLAREALLTSVRSGYRSLITYLEADLQKAGEEDGVWRLPKGKEFYAFALRRTTSTELSAEEIHEIGLKEVARIHEEMRGIMRATKFEGTLQEFFEFMRTEPRFYLANSEEGRAQYLARAVSLIDTMRERLDEVFVTKPKAPIRVKRVEAFREQSAGKAFYSDPSPDGSRPGTFYANLYRMERMPTYQMEALAYHEGIPGHHMQVAIALELQNIPEFRKHAWYTAYGEGWALYSEFLAKEMGLYEDPYSDFGRLAMELWRACRLVVDTGLHDKGWTRQQGIDYLKANTPNPEGDVVNAIERYIVMPSQATAYKIGMLEILRLRESAKERVGDAFELREFHDVILANGPVPLAILEELVEEWISAKDGA